MQELIEKDAVELLNADHLAVKHLFVEYARLAVAGGSDPNAAADKLALAKKICSDLTVHAQIEEEIFYPALRRASGADDLVDEAEAEHREAKDLIAQIQALPAADMTMDDLVSRLACAIEHHVKEERVYLFTKARSVAGLDLDALAEQLKTRQAELEGQMK